MLKYEYENEADIPAEVKGFYAKQADGKWKLQVEGGVVRKSVHDEFRNNNTGLDQTNRQLKAQLDAYEGVTAEEALRLKSIQKDLDEAKLVKKGEIDKVVEDRTAEMRRKHELELKKANDRATNAETELSNLKIDAVAVAEALKYGLIDSAADDLKTRIRSMFKLVDGQAVALKPDNTPIYDDDGQKLSIEREVKNLAAGKAPHLFKANKGGGGQPGAGGGGGSGPAVRGDDSLNPWSKEHWNLTKQGAILKTDRARAERLASAAGKKLPPAPAAA